MNKTLNIVLIIAVLVGLLVASGAVYTVDETQQAVITQFGKPIGEPITQAGLYFKLPFIQTANYFDKRILQWDGDPTEIPTLDKKYIWVDTTARWRIADALLFMQSMGSERLAYARLDDILDSAARDAVSSQNLVETVRNSNRLTESKPKEQILETEINPIQKGREALTRDIVRRAGEILPQYGIKLIDVRIKRVNYVKEVRRKVFDRMISERKRAAEELRSEGQGRKAEIEGQMTKELQQIQSEAYRKAQEIKGKADAEAIKIYADAYNNDPDFYSFLKTLETYQSTLDKDTTLIINTNSEYFKYLQDIGIAK